MGKANKFNSVPSSQLDFYRKQLGKQEHRVIKSHNKLIEKQNVEKSTKKTFQVVANKSKKYSF